MIEVESSQSGTTIVNTASVTMGGQEANPADNSDSVATAVRDYQSDLGVAHLNPPATATVGTVVTYGLRVFNEGPDNEPEARLTLTVAPGVTVHSTGTLSCNSSMNVVTCPLGLMPSGSTQLLQLMLRAPAAGTTLRHTVDIRGMRVDPTGGNNLATAETALLPAGGRRRSTRH